MKKNILNVLVMLLALCCLFVGCDNPANSGEEDEKVSAGWYKYTRDSLSNLPEQKAVIIYINEKGEIERVGNEIWEYEKTALVNFKTIYANFSNKDIRDDFFQVSTAPNYKYLTVVNNENLDAGWYSYKTDNGTTTNFIYINSKGTVTIAGDSERFSSNSMNELYETFYSEQISIYKTNTGFSVSIENNTMEFSLTTTIPDWCTDFEYL